MARHQPWLVESVDALAGGNLIPGGLDGLLEEWADGLAKPETRRAYTRDVEGFLTHLNVRTDRQLLNVREHQVAVWRDFLARELDAGRLSYQSTKRRMSALTSLLDFLNRQGHVTTNPVRGVKRPRRPEHERQRARRRTTCSLPNCPALSAEQPQTENVLPKLLDQLLPSRQLTLW